MQFRNEVGQIKLDIIFADLDAEEVIIGACGIICKKVSFRVKGLW